MARPLRIEYEGAVYHVTARGNERKKIYFTKADYFKFKEYLIKTQEKYGILIHCYVLMTNHYHLIIETPDANLCKVMHYINGSYTNYINRKRERCGHLFQGRYKAILVDQDSYLLEVSRYLHLNPVRAGMVSKPEDYDFSSYSSYISSEEEGVVSNGLILGMVAKRRRSAKRTYKLFVESAIGEELDNPLEKIYGGVILGDDKFVKEVLGRVSDEQLEKEETSYRRALKSVGDYEAIIDLVAEHFQISKDEILTDKASLYRKISIYLMKRHTDATNNDIGKLFDISYSAVVKAYQRFENLLKKDFKLKQKVERLQKLL